MVENEDNIDEILSDIGIGKFHVINFVVILIVIMISSLPSLAYIFTTRDLSYRCMVPECESNSGEFNQTWLSVAIPFEDGLPRKCERFSVQETSVIDSKCDNSQFDNTTRIPCSDWIYSDGGSIVKEFNFPCEDWKRSLVGTINSAGQFASLLFSGILSDRYGRRNVMLIMTATSGIFGLIQSFSPSYTFFLILEFLNLAASSGAYTALFVLMIEITLPRYRIVGSAMADISYALCNVALGLVAWTVPSWQWLLRAAAIPTFFVLLFFFAIPESFRWLNSKGRKDECVAILRKAAESNNAKFSERGLAALDRIVCEEKINSIEKKIDSESSFLSIIKIPRLAFRLLNCSFCWFSTILVYYGLSLNSVNISSGEDSFYLNFIYVALIDIPAVFVYLIMSYYMSRKATIIFNLLASGALCIVYAVTPNINGTLALIIYLLSKMFILVSLSMTYIVTTEIFPTNLRNTSVNFCSVIARIGAALAPQIPLLAKVNPSLPMIFFGIFPLASGVFILALPETKNKKLPDTIKEAIQLGK